MNKLLFVFVFCIVGTFADDAADDGSVETVCLKPQGLQYDLVKYFEEMAKPKSKILTPEVEEKLSCALACIYEEEKPHRASLHTIVICKINESDVTEDKRKELLDIVNNCKTQAGEDHCKYLKCIKVTRQPFPDLLFLKRKHHNKREDVGLPRFGK